jgi:ATP-dependent protease HslVU (ClpYQ) peptidase subunit
MTMWSDGTYDEIRCEFYAIGSGRQFARGAMANGASAEDAVLAAIICDTTSGGSVEVLRA